MMNFLRRELLAIEVGGRRLAVRFHHALLVLAIVVAAIVVFAAGVFAGSAYPYHATQLEAPRVPAEALKAKCPPGGAFPGCATLPSAPLQTLPPPTQPKPGDPPMFPDVSSWQGHPNWSSVKSWQLSHGWPTGAIFKLGEYVQDPDASYNASSLHSLGMAAAGYWFVRNYGCDAEASRIESVARSLGIKVVWLDLEVPEARGYGSCLSPRLRSAGFTVGEYTSPGSNPGGVDTSDPLWQAEFGSLLHPIWTPVAAWQCSDGVYGCRTFVPGVGYDDVSQDFGALRLASGGVTPAPTVPLCSRTMCYSRFYGKTWKATSGTYCRKGCVEREFVRWWQGAQHQSHAHRLWLRYRIQALDRHLEAVIHRSSLATNRKLRRYSRAGILERIGFKARFATSWNGYLKLPN